MLAALLDLVDHLPLDGRQILHLVDEHDVELGRQLASKEQLQHVGEIVQVVGLLVGAQAPVDVVNP